VTTSIPCTGLETEEVEVLMARRAAEFFGAKLARAASWGVSGNVPATLSLSLGAPASFGAFTPGVAREHSASSTASVISSAGNAVLSVADPGANATGRLVTGAFSLVEPLQAQASSAAGVGAAFAAVDGSAAPTTAAHLCRSGEQRRRHARLPAIDRRPRGAAHGRLRQGADVHALDVGPVAFTA
jgi:hypothetical protein